MKSKLRALLIFIFSTFIFYFIVDDVLYFMLNVMIVIFYAIKDLLLMTGCIAFILWLVHRRIKKIT